MRALKAILAAILVGLFGTLVSCGTMGGGGMRYLGDLPAATVELIGT
jgi:hypothetical protein